MKIKNWNIEELTGYKPLTTLYMDFSIADKFGKNAILSTFNEAKKEYKGRYKYQTELAMVLNWKLWEHYDGDNPSLAKIYNDLFTTYHNYLLNSLKGEELSYYIWTTD